MHRRRIEWPERLSAALVTLILGEVHLRIFGCTESTRLAVTVYLATSALFNLSAIICYDRLLAGRLRSDVQVMVEIAIALNFLAWLTYMLQASPAVVNIMTEALTYGTYVRLLWISDGDTDAGGWRDLLCRVANLWNSLFRRGFHRHQDIFFEKKKS